MNGVVAVGGHSAEGLALAARPSYFNVGHSGWPQAEVQARIALGLKARAGQHFAHLVLAASMDPHLRSDSLGGSLAQRQQQPMALVLDIVAQEGRGVVEIGD